MKLFIIVINLFLSFIYFDRRDLSIYEVLDQTFLHIVDTTAYSSGRQLLVPGEKYSFPISDKYCLNVKMSNDSLLDIVSSIRSMIKKDKEVKDFNSLLDKGQIHDPIDFSRIKNTGKYILVNEVQRDCLSISGKIYFYQPFILNDKAIVSILKWDSPKSGVAITFFIRKLNGRWMVVKKEANFWI